MILVLAFAVACPYVSANTFILKNGKRIEGVVQVEDQDSLRIIDSTGVRMTLKKDSVNWEQVRTVNSSLPQPGPVTPLPESNVQPPLVKPVVVLTNRDVVAQRPRYRNAKEEIRVAERELNRLSDACRAAGASSPSMRVWTTTTYIVHGKAVTVSGYWAHPANIENAKRICNSANEAQQNLNRLLESAGGR